jgi:AcrR family transcriptional regulator
MGSVGVMADVARERYRKLTPRAEEIITTARGMLEEEGYEALSMRNLAQRLGIQAPALYRHFADKRAIELIIIEQGLWESGDRNLAAIEDADDPLEALMSSHRGWALEHPHLYRLSYGAELDRSRLDQDAEWHSGEALRRVTGNTREVSRAIWAFVHGMIELQLLDRFPDDSDVEAIWRTGVEAMRTRLPAG